MKLLLDTHAYLWFTLQQPGISTAAMDEIQSLANEKFISAASYWEIAIKISRGQYTLTVPFCDFWHDTTIQNGIVVLPITVEHAERVSTLPFHHKDPFDRLIVAQALHEKMTLVSADAILDQYNVWRIS